MKSKVFFAGIRAKGKQTSRLERVKQLFEAAEIRNCIKERDFVAIKLHFGEQGNIGYIRPVLVRPIVDKVKHYGGHPFLTDTNTLYLGPRSNPVDHILQAFSHGFTFDVVNAPIIIADGIKSRNFVPVEINQKHISVAKIAGEVYHAEALISVTHFKGHMLTGFGGTIKNVGMGLGSRAAKQAMHSSIAPVVDLSVCKGCGQCLKWCPVDAISLKSRKAVIDSDKCAGCGECTAACLEGAIAINWDSGPGEVQERVCEYAYAALKNKQGKAAYYSFITDVSPDCDCMPWNDAPIIPDLGVMCSLDPVAIDQASVDLVNKSVGLYRTALTKNYQAGDDKFKDVHPQIDWEIQLAYAEKLGLGSRQYELIEI